MSTFTFEDLWSEFQPVVDGVAYEFAGAARRWGAETADFRQECVTWMLDNESKLVAKYGEMEPEAFGKYLAQALRNEMSDYSVDIRDQAGGQPRQSAYWYSIGELKALLPAVLDPESWLEPPQYDGGGSRGRGVPSEGGNWVTTLADVSRSFENLSTADRSLLRDFHETGWTNQELARLEDISEQTMSSRHMSALKRLQKQLGGPKPDPMRPNDATDPWRGRRAISNANARALTSSYYDE